MIEFAFLLALLLMALLGTVDASLWGIAGMAVAQAAGRGVLVAAEAQGTSSSALPATQDVFGVVAAPLRDALPGTAVLQWPAGSPCPTPAQVAATYPHATVVVCAIVGPPSYVTVQVVGDMAAFIPPPFGFGTAHGIPLSFIAVSRKLTFAP